MERRGIFRRIKAAVITDSTPSATNKLQGVMEGYGVSNSKELPLGIRTQLARELYKVYKDKTGEFYQGGDTPTLGLWFGTLENLGPDAVANCIDEGLISPKLFGSIRATEKSSEFRELAITQGWKQDNN